MTVAVYVRQSLDQTGEGAAVERQLEEVTALCRREKWDWVEYRDNDTSAYTLKKPRKDYQRMLDDIARGDITHVVVWATDRLYRRLEDLIPLIDLLNAHNVELHQVRGGRIDLTTPTGRTHARMMAVFAQYEMEQKSDRQKAMHRQRARDGRNWWTHRPFGFVKADAGTDGSGAELHPVEAPLIREAYEKALAGVPLYSIQKEWNAAGIKTSRGYEWRDARLRELLLNPRNAGQRAHNGKIIGDADWPAIVPVDLYNAVVQLITNPARNIAGPSRARKALLVGIAKCGNCGAKINSGTTASGVAIYRCKGCFKIGRSQQPIDDHVLKNLHWRLTETDISSLLLADNANIDELRAQHRICDSQLKEAASLYAKRKISAETLEQISQEVEQEMRDLEAQMFDANKSRTLADVLDADLAAEGFGGATLDARRAVIDALMEITMNVVPSRKPFDPDHADEFVSIVWRDETGES